MTRTQSGGALVKTIKWIVCGAVLLGALGAGVLGAFWLYTHVLVLIPIRDQPIGVDLPAEFQATANVTNDLIVDMNGEISTSVPFAQELTVPFHGRYDFDVELEAEVPVSFDVVYDGILPIDTSADIQIRTSINYKNLKALRNLNIETSLPLRFPLPVKLTIPVSDVIDLKFAGPLSADIDQDLKTRVDTVLKTRLPINQKVTTPVTAALPLTVYPADDQVRLLLTTMDIALQPARMLRFAVTENPDEPRRVKNPYGPRDAAGANPR